MADVTLSNIAEVTGTYASIPTTVTSQAVVTEIIKGLTITKVADKQNWVTGDLTYTITIVNNAVSPLENPIITDTLDPTIIKLVDNSVKVDNATAEYNYVASTGINYKFRDYRSRKDYRNYLSSAASIRITGKN